MKVGRTVEGAKEPSFLAIVCSSACAPALVHFKCALVFTDCLFDTAELSHTISLHLEHIFILGAPS